MTTWLTATALVIVVPALIAFLRHRDPLHPAVVLAPLLFYGYVYDPWTIMQAGNLEKAFPDPGKLTPVLALNVLGCAMMILGCLVGTRRLIGWRANPHHAVLQAPPDLAQRRHIVRIALVMATIAVAIYFHAIHEAGGIAKVFGRSKGGVYFSSGYLGEAIMLGLPAVVLLGWMWQGRKISLLHIGVALMCVSPQLLQGTLGGRRGPLFLALSALVFAWMLSRTRRVPLKVLAPVFGLILLSVIFVWSQRQHLYLGSENAEVKVEELVDRLAGEEEFVLGNTYVFGSGQVLASDFSNTHFWGRRIFVTLFVRPIPSFLWPSKYQDTNAVWTFEDRPVGGMSKLDWYRSVGWIPINGSAGGAISDLFVEFSWGAVLACFGFGWGLGWLWMQKCLGRPLFGLLFFEAMMLTVYIPTQSFSAWYHRFFILAVPTWLAWKYLIEPGFRMRPVAVPRRAVAHY